MFWWVCLSTDVKMWYDQYRDTRPVRKVRRWCSYQILTSVIYLYYWIHWCIATWSLFGLHSKEGKNVYDIIYALSTGPSIDNKIEPIKMQEYVKISEASAFALLVTKIAVILPIKNLHMPIYIYVYNSYCISWLASTMGVHVVLDSLAMYQLPLAGTHSGQGSQEHHCLVPQ